MRVEDQIRNLASKLEAEQAPVTVDEIMSGVNVTEVSCDAVDDRVGRSGRGWLAAAAAGLLLVVGVGGLWLVGRDDSSRIDLIDSPAPSTASAPTTPATTTILATTTIPATTTTRPTTTSQVVEAVTNGAAVIGETITFDDGGMARVNGIRRDAPARNTLYGPLRDGSTSTEIEVEHCIGGDDYRPTLNWQPPESWLIAEWWSGILDDGTEVEARAGYFMQIESRPGACSRGYLSIPTPSGSNLVAMTLSLEPSAGVEPIGIWDVSQSRPIEAPLQPTTPSEAAALGEPMIPAFFDDVDITVLEVIDNATPKQSAVDVRDRTEAEPPAVGRKLVEIRARVCADPTTPPPRRTAASVTEEFRWLIETNDHYVGNGGGETSNGWDPEYGLGEVPGVASTLVVDRRSASETPPFSQCIEGYVQIDLPDDAVPADVIVTVGDGHFREVGRIRLGE